MENENIKILIVVARALGELKERMIFVGGATAGLYATDPAATEIRPTDDVDCIIELTSRAKFYDLEDSLRAKGFVNEQKVICRWNFKGITVDIMPTDPAILGFSNKWYPEGIKSAIDFNLSDDLKIKIFSSPYFIATKLEAFNDRGKGEMRWSSDFEDIIYVLDNREEITEELINTKGKVKEYIKKQFIKILENKSLEEGLACALPYGSGKAGVEKIKGIMKIIVNQ